jgi:hypothetical protein
LQAAISHPGNGPNFVPESPMPHHSVTPLPILTQRLPAHRASCMSAARQCQPPSLATCPLLSWCWLDSMPPGPPQGSSPSRAPGSDPDRPGLRASGAPRPPLSAPAQSISERVRSGLLARAIAVCSPPQPRMADPVTLAVTPTSFEPCDYGLPGGAGRALDDSVRVCEVCGCGCESEAPEGGAKGGACRCDT